MKYPKEWLEALSRTHNLNDGAAGWDYYERILDGLSELGALKDPPKLREFWVVKVRGDPPIDYHLYVFDDKDSANAEASSWDAEVIHVREVLDER